MIKDIIMSRDGGRRDRAKPYWVEGLSPRGRAGSAEVGSAI